MSDVTRILSAIEEGDPHAAEHLLPLVYDELRKLAAQRLSQEKPGQTLEATALVHEAYLRRVGTREERHWDSRGHFFAAAAEAMRRILVESARRSSGNPVETGSESLRRAAASEWGPQPALARMPLRIAPGPCTSVIIGTGCFLFAVQPAPAHTGWLV